MIATSDLNLNAYMKCIKCVLIVFTFIFVVTGIMLIVIGSTINAIYSEFSYFLQARLFSPTALLVFIGFTIFAVAGLGFIGAIRESSKMILMFGLCLLVIFLLEMAAGVTGYFLATEVKGVLSHSLNQTMKEYTTNEMAKETIDTMQIKLQCCGIFNASDWDKILIGKNESIPDSCCIASYPDCTELNQHGCLPRLEFVIEESGFILASTAVTIASMQLFGVIFSLMLGKILRSQKHQRELRRWMMREQLLNNFDYYIIKNDSNSITDVSNKANKM